MKTTKSKNKLTGEEMIRKQADELREFADSFFGNLMPSARINLLRDDMQSMASEIRESMARSRVAMLASIDILLAGEDLLSHDLLKTLQEDREYFKPDNEPESQQPQQEPSTSDEFENRQQKAIDSIHESTDALSLDHLEFLAEELKGITKKLVEAA